MRLNPMLRIVLPAAAIVLLGAPTLRAQERIRPDGADPRVRALVEMARAWAADGGESTLGTLCATLQEAIEERGDLLATDDGRTYRPAHAVLARSILDLGPQGIAEYREAFDARAGHAYRAALEARDPQAMAAVHRTWFASSFGDDAAWWLARDRMDRGEMGSALHLLLALDAGADDASPCHPDPDVPAGALLSRIAICQAELGDGEAVAATVARLAACRPPLPAAARSRLDAALAARASVDPAVVPLPAGRFRPRWVIPQHATRDWSLESYGLSLDLQALEEIRADLARYPILEEVVGELQRAVLLESSIASSRPVLLDGALFARLASSVARIDPRTGDVDWIAPGQDAIPAGREIAWRYRLDLAWGTIAIANGRLAAIESDFGCAREPAGARPNAIGSFRTDGVRAPSRLRLSDEVGGEFLGPPVAAGRELVALVRDEPQATRLLALDRDTLETAWSVDLGGPFGTRSQSTWSSSLPAPAEFVAVESGTAYWAGGTGAVVAIDLLERRPRWILAYPRRTPSELLRLGIDGWLASEPLVQGRFLLVAPVDSPSLLCLDARTGRELWRQPRERAFLLLGARRGLVYAGGRGLVARRIAEGGAIEWEHSDLVLLGRPAFAAGEIFVGAEYRGQVGILHLDDRTGRILGFDPAPTLGSGPILPGNLVFSGEVLVSAGPWALMGLERVDARECSVPGMGALVARGEGELRAALSRAVDDRYDLGLRGR